MAISYLVEMITQKLPHTQPYSPSLSHHNLKQDEKDMQEETYFDQLTRENSLVHSVYLRAVSP